MATCRYFFMHLMKTAGTSLTAQLHARFGPGEIYPEPGDPEQGLRYWEIDRYEALPAHRRDAIRFVGGHFPYFARDIIEPDVTITLLRDPVDRVLSHLRHVQRHDPTLADVPLEAIYDGCDLFRNYQVRMFGRTRSDDPGVVDESCLQRALDHVESVEVVGVTDRYEQLLERLSPQFGPPPPSRHLQVAPPGPPVSRSFRRRIEADHAFGYELYARAREISARQSRVSVRPGP